MLVNVMLKKNAEQLSILTSLENKKDLEKECARAHH